VAWQLIDAPGPFGDVMASVDGATPVAMDTEAASFHRYHDRIYLLQLSSPGGTLVIDPLGVGDLAPVGALLADPAIEKVFHDAVYDLRLLNRQYGFTARHLFDTRIAAQLLNEPGIGLAALLEKYFGLRPDKRFQRADWSTRPLTDAMLQYAAGDTSHLLELRSQLLQNLRETGREEWAVEEFELLENTRWDGAPTDRSDDYLRMKGSRALDRRGLAVLRELHRWRDEVAAETDRAAFRIIGNEALLELSRHPVRSVQQLGGVKGVGRETLIRWGTEIVAAISRGEAVPESELPRFPRGGGRAPDPGYEERLARLKARRNDLARQFDLAPGVLCPNGTLEAIARAEPRDMAQLTAVDAVRRWQAGAFGAELLAAVAG
jgi:ribonuclease D